MIGSLDFWQSRPQTRKTVFFSGEEIKWILWALISNQIKYSYVHRYSNKATAFSRFWTPVYVLIFISINQKTIGIGRLNQKGWCLVQAHPVNSREVEQRSGSALCTVLIVKYITVAVDNLKVIGWHAMAIQKALFSQKTYCLPYLHIICVATNYFNVKCEK